jgi:hypothetical protein
MGSSAVVAAGVLGQDQPQVSFAEDQHPVGDLGPAVSTNRSSPWIRWYPQPWFSVAGRSISAMISALSGGRPVWYG